MTVKDWLRFWGLGLIWGTAFLWIKIALSEVSPAVLVSFRTLFGGIVLLFVVLFNKSDRLKWKEIRPFLGLFAIIGLINVALPHLMAGWAMQYIDSGVAAILNSTVTLFSLIIAPIFIKEERLSLPRVVGLMIGFFGVVVLFIPDLAKGITMNLIGQVVMLLSSLGYAVAGVLARIKAAKLNSNMQAFLQLLMANMMLWSFTLVVENPIRFPHTPLTWLALLWLGLLGAGVAYMLYFSLLHSIGPMRTAMVSYIPPLMGVIMGTIFLGERLHFEALMGGLLIISGIAVVNIKKIPSRHTSSPDILPS